jgi:glutaredoxin
MRKLIFISLIGFAVWSWNTGRLPFMSTAGAFDEEGNPLVWIFTIKNCGKACEIGRQNLKRRRVDFEEILIDPNNDNDPDVQLWKNVGKGGFPLIVAGDFKIKNSGSLPMLQEMLGKNFGELYLTRAERKLFKNHFYSDGTPRIVLYGADWCPYCKKLREDLNANNIDFLEIDVDKSRDKQQIINTLDIPGYPAVWVGYTRVKGSDFRAVKKLL